MTLDDHIRCCARDTGLRVGVSGTAVNALRTALATDPVMMAETKARLAEIDARVVERDHVSRWRRELLQRVTGA